MFYKYSLILIILLSFTMVSFAQPHENQLSILNRTISNEKVAQLKEPENIPEPTSIKYQSTLGNKSLKIKKPIYEKGEKIEALFKFKGALFVHPYIRIYKFENETWNFLGMWDFTGIEYTCCGAFPPCSEYNSAKDSPIKITWDQKVVEEPLPVLPGQKITKKQVDFGKYKIRVVYGDQPVCSDALDAEFLIK